jgi:hypothetical protein
VAWAVALPSTIGRSTSMTAPSPLLLFRDNGTGRIRIQRQAPPLPDLRETATPCSPLSDVRSTDKYKLDLNTIVGD